jgi:hypothetical protein
MGRKVDDSRKGMDGECELNWKLVFWKINQKEKKY